MGLQYRPELIGMVAIEADCAYGWVVSMIGVKVPQYVRLKLRASHQAEIAGSSVAWTQRDTRSSN